MSRTGFTVKQLGLPPSLDQAPIVSLALKNQCMLIAQTNGDLSRYFTDQKDYQKIKFSYPVPPPVGGIMGFAGSALASVTTSSSPSTVKVDIASVYLSDSAFHGLIGSTNGETFYLSLESGTAFAIPKLKGHVVTAAWFTDDSAETRFEALIGTQSGKVFEITYDVKKYPDTCTFKLACELANERITDIFRHSTTVFVSTDTCAHMLSSSGPVLMWTSPISCLGSRFAIHSEVGSSSGTPYLSWLNGVCIISTKLPVTSSSYNPTLSIVVPHSTCLGMKVDVNKPPQIPSPRGFFVTDYHYVILYGNAKLVLVSRISLGSPVASVPTLPTSSLVMNASSAVLWSPERKVSQILLSNEHVDAWKHWLKKRNYSKALASTAVKAERAFVLKHEADFLIDSAAVNEKKEAARRAASLYSSALKEDASFIESFFEEIASKLEFADKRSVLEFLMARMDSAAETEDASKEVVQMSVLFIYCVHVMVELLSEVDNHQVEQILLQFVSDKHQALDKQCLHATFDLLESVGLFEPLVKVAEIVGDLETAVRVDLQLGNYERIIDRLGRNNMNELSVSLSPLLFRFCPKEFISMVLKKFSTHAEIFSNALAMCGALGREHKEQAVLLIKHCLSRGDRHHGTQKAKQLLLSLLITLLCELGDEQGVCYAIETNHSSGFFDSDFSLRSVRQAKMDEAETVLLSVSGLHVRATQKALLANKTDLAKSCAWRSPVADVRRQCWTEILKFFSQKGQTELLIDLFRESEVLDITDLLPLLPVDAGEAAMASIKDEIDKEIKATASQLEKSKTDIDNYQKALELIRKDITSKPNECVLLSHSQKCDICFRLLFSERFLAFNCAHCFHEECLKEVMTKRLAGIRSLEDQMAAISANCCMCGHNSLLLDQLFEHFIDPSVDAAAIDAWTVSY